MKHVQSLIMKYDAVIGIHVEPIIIFQLSGPKAHDPLILVITAVFPGSVDDLSVGDHVVVSSSSSVSTLRTSRAFISTDVVTVPQWIMFFSCLNLTWHSCLSKGAILLERCWNCVHWTVGMSSREH